jgi:Flp pilus assembly protein TadG
MTLHQRMTESLSALCGFMRRANADTRGNVAMMFGLALPVLVMIGFGAVDIHQASKVKANLQDALDAAALAAARSKYTDDVNLNRVGLAALKANMPNYFKDGSQDTASFTLNDNKITADARVNVKVLVANIVLPPYGKLMDDYLPVGSSSEVLRASRNVEVAMALDITGSMKGQPLIDLKAAANELIDIVVQDQQTPFYSKVGLAPYAVGVNLGTYAASARGTIPAPVAITNAQWKSGAAKNIGGITRANPAVFTSNNHGFSNGDYVWISGISGMTQMNNRVLEIVNKATNTFQVRVPGQSNALSTSSGYNSYSSGGTIQKCLVSDCSAVVTASGHGLKNGEAVYIDEVKGMTKKSWVVGNVTANSFSTGVLATSYGTYTSAGRAWCAQQGCEWYRFDNASGGVSTYQVSTCASERTGSQAYTDAAPTSGARVGRSYTDSGNPCPSATIMPLSSSRTDLKSAINALEDDGSTAGQIGIAWGWYLVSPNFSSLWTGSSTPAAYDAKKTLKVVILMTDGEFNTPFCQDVIAKNAGNGSGGAATHINCNATNGNAFSQSVSLCNGMRDQDIVVYTVGFNLGSNPSTGGAGVDTAIEVLRTCATNENTHFFNANGGADLKDAFKAIGRDITRLRIAR